MSNELCSLSLLQSSATVSEQSRRKKKQKMSPELGTFYERINTLPLVHEFVRGAVQRYEKAKLDYPAIVSAVTTVEQGVSQIAARAKPAYEQYLHDKVSFANRTACNTLEYLEKKYPQIKMTPNELRDIGVHYYEESKMLQRAMNTIYWTKSEAIEKMSGAKLMAVSSVNVGVGTMVISTQFSMAAAIFATNIGIDAFNYSKFAALNALRSIHHCEQLVGRALVNTMLSGKATANEVARLAANALHGPTDKLMDNTDAFLDLLDATVIRYINTQSDQQSVIIENENFLPIINRLATIASKMTAGLTRKAQNEVFSPLKQSIHRATDNLKGALLVVDYVKEKQQWASEQVSENYARLSASIHQMTKTLEDQAKEIKERPETVLLRTIQLSSSALSTAADQLVQRSNNVIPEPYSSQVHAAVTYIQKLDQSFSEADSLFAIRDELVTEAKVKLGVVEQLLVLVVDRLADLPPISWMAMKNGSSTASVGDIVNGEVQWRPDSN